ncbi:uncharacterized protein LOC143428254 [Xylocopa sonorina]|uniref:uncharacterized protein LOC143428254 n=1 Tax=Xylocopa sonorina TaxID=1818115 RepID=UPI00403AB3A7
MAPGTCSCNPGYEPSKTEKNVCEPICRVNCVNGYCNEPNACKCDPGYRPLKNDSNHCVPHCAPACEHGYCSAPNNCTCENGYQASPDDPLVCKPICSKYCHLGTCTAPETCTCLEGFSKIDAETCDLICSQPCVNGYCAKRYDTRTATCKCNDGYRLSGNDSNVCEPVCEHPCENGFCDAPNNCSCNEGYRLSEESWNVCLPVCRKSCGPNGYCVAPDACNCNDGYKSSADNGTEFVCEPVCESNCENGVCTAPNQCTCHRGYEKKEGEESCEPFCRSCENGTCVEPEICACDQGFVSVQRENRTVCEPYCRNCTNGKCVAPDDCRCDVSFVKQYTDDSNNDTVCVSVCKNNCNDRGSCDLEKNACNCYHGWKGVYCEEPEYCIVTMDNEDNRLNVSNIEYDVNDTINYVLANSPLCSHDCYDEINNETLCLGKYNNTIACFIGTDSSCYRVNAEYKSAPDYRIIGGAAAVGTIAACSVAAIYLLTRKYQRGRFSLGNAATTSAQGESSASLDGKKGSIMGYVGSVVLLNAILVTGSTAWASNDESLCVVVVSRRVSMYVPYTETYKDRKWGVFHQTRTRTNYKIEYKTVWVHDMACCFGYQKIDDRCVPICTNPCVHGNCTEPETCECEKGYRPSKDTARERYVCEPMCETDCANGVCKLPNECACNAGYQLTEDKLHCSPICRTNCEQGNARCLEPGKCTCDPGYRIVLSILSPNEDTRICAPICEVPCINSECTAPNRCTCNDGYEMDADDLFACKPKCEPICLHGNCTAPNVCICDPGYRMSNDEHCEPVCGQPCTMGTCIAPDVCSCNDGYGLLSNDSKYVCEPICEKPCVNGNCIAPELCACHDGYASNPDRNLCEPYCEKSCVNGECIAAGICNCTEGYRLNETAEERVCVPICKVPCEPRGICVAPDTCNCSEGYRSIDTGTNGNEIPVNVTEARGSVCEPVCSQTCENGKCTEPNVCTCNKGYAIDEEGGRCEPVCSSCYNGSCIGPELCRCFEGFVLSNESICVPYCNDSCVNGECVAPYECRCYAGFQTSVANNSCIEPCTRSCQGHGVCIEDDKPCECSLGWTGWDCDQPTVCILLLNLDDGNLDELTIHNETNSTLMDARLYAPYCYRCNETVTDQTFCFAITEPEDRLSTATVGCFVDTGPTCYQMYNSSHSTAAVSRIAGTLAAVTVLIMAAVTTAMYFLIRSHQRKKMRAGIE